MTNVQTAGKQQKHFAGLLPLAVIAGVLLMSPVIYFTVMTLLGHTDLFAINGAK